MAAPTYASADLSLHGVDYEINQRQRKVAGTALSLCGIAFAAIPRMKFLEAAIAACAFLRRERG